MSAVAAVIGRLFLDLRTSGAKVFLYRCYVGGKRQFITLGRYGQQGLTLEGARARARELAEILRKHGDVREYLQREEEGTRRARRAEELIRTRQGTFQQLLAAYVENLVRTDRRSRKEVEGALRRHVIEPFPDLLSRRAVDIEPQDVHKILRRVASLGHTRTVNKLRAYLHAAFAFGATAEYDPRQLGGAEVAGFGLERNPATLTKRVAEFDQAGERALGRRELLAYVANLDRVPNEAVRAFLRAHILLGGQRIVQLLRLTWADINLDAGTLKLRDAKGRGAVERDHILPISPAVREGLEKAPRFSTEFVFSTDVDTHINNATVSKVVAKYAEWLGEHQQVESFSASDLRRTAETHLAQLGVSKEHRAHLLSHGREGVQARHYDKYLYLREKREALERWERYLAGDRGAEILPLRAESA